MTERRPSTPLSDGRRRHARTNIPMEDPMYIGLGTLLLIIILILIFA
jgi:hypothetical protein